MRTRKITLKIGAGALALATLPLAVSQALAATYYLQAAPTTVSMPNPNGGAAISVPMWGYASCDSSFTTCDPVTVPGPALTVSDGSLTVHLKNTLAVPTSLVVNGLYKPMAPVWDNGTSGARPSPASRVRSFDAEAAPGTVATYAWPTVSAGTYLYQSGTQTQVQVQMGLYGAVAKSVLAPVVATASQVGVAGEAYPGLAYDNEATLLYSEIDVALHNAVDSGSYGTTGPTSTLNYQPSYFLINGKPYEVGAALVRPAGNVGTTLLRLLNAGLTTHVPMIQGKFWDIVAEDGKPYAYKKTQYTAMLPAAKTMDVMLTAEVGATYPILDRRLSLSNAGLSKGGMMAFLSYGATSISGTGTLSGGNHLPVAADDGYDSVKGATLNVPSASGVLLNDSDPDVGQTVKAVAASGATSGLGSYTLNANGSFTYTPAAGFSGDDTFSYQATDGKALSAPATVTITVTTPVEPALTQLDDFARADGPLGSSWTQNASNDVQVVGGIAKAVGVVSGGLALWNAASFGQVQAASFTSASSLANSGLILKATGGTRVEEPANYIRVRYESGNGGEVVVSTMLGGSGVSTYIKWGSFPAASSSGTLTASADAKGLVTVWLNGALLGGVQLPDAAAWKGSGRIGMQLQTVGATVDDFKGGSL